MKLLLILALSVAVRFSAPSHPAVTGIASSYAQLAANIRAGHGYVLGSTQRPILYYTPGYAYWRALWR